MPVEERIIVEGMHEALIDKETFDIVQDMIKSRTGVRERNYEWLLKGLLEYVKNQALHHIDT